MKTAYLVDLLCVVLVAVVVVGGKKQYYMCRKTDSMGGYYMRKCPCSDGVWANWGYWRPRSECGRTCYAKTRICIRNCGKRCRGAEMDYVGGCDTMKCPADGGWSDYTPWSPMPTCPVSCGGGVVSISRHRACFHPPPAYSGKQCVGNSSEVLYVNCNKDRCPGT